jgi:hypothetical protein
MSINAVFDTISSKAKFSELRINHDLRKSDNEGRIFKLLTKIVIEQAVLKLINSLSSRSSKSIESNPDQQGTTDVIALNTSLTTLATF